MQGLGFRARMEAFHMVGCRAWKRKWKQQYWFGFRVFALGLQVWSLGPKLQERLPVVPIHRTFST